MAACAHAKFTGELGVCLSTGGPGLIHMLNGMYDAKLDHTPLLAIVGQQAMAGIGGSEQQEVDLLPLVKDVASGYAEVIGKPRASPSRDRRAVPSRARPPHGDVRDHTARRAARGIKEPSTNTRCSTHRRATASRASYLTTMIFSGRPKC